MVLQCERFSKISRGTATHEGAPPCFFFLSFLSFSLLNPNMTNPTVARDSFSLRLSLRLKVATNLVRLFGCLACLAL